jgi:hypothetical protein
MARSPASGAASRGSTGELLFCELPDGTTGALPAWLTDAAACAALTVGAPVVSIAALQELRELLDAVAPRARPSRCIARSTARSRFPMRS